MEPTLLSSTPKSDSKRKGASCWAETITTTYRADFGGAKGTTASAWTSNSLSGSPANSLEIASPETSAKNTSSPGLVSERLRQTTSPPQRASAEYVQCKAINSTKRRLPYPVEIISGRGNVVEGAADADQRILESLEHEERQQAASVLQHSPTGRPSLLGNEDYTKSSVRDSSNLAVQWLSTLTTGGREAQLSAATLLTDSMKTHGEPVRAAVQHAGGVHLLKTFIKTSDVQLRTTCMAALVQLMQYKRARNELLSSVDTDSLNRLVKMILNGICSGNVLCLELFMSLVAEGGDAIKLACAETKAVRFLVDALVSSGSHEDSEQMPSPEALLLHALEAMCSVDSGPMVRKLAWGGGLAAVAQMGLRVPYGQSTAPATRLLKRASKHDPGCLVVLCDAKIIHLLAILLGDPQVPEDVQVGAAEVLSTITSLCALRADAKSALIDHALPRACELLHSFADLESFTGLNRALDQAEVASGQDHLLVACAQLIGRLACGSPLCCHVILFHTKILSNVLGMLVTAGEFELAGQLLNETATYASHPMEGTFT